MADPKPWADPNSSGNKIRPDVKCIGCGAMGCITHWGPWCFDCNVKRMTRLDKSFSDLAESVGMKRFD